ncbi:B9 domain-containing protein 2 [Parasteatoda tepidariorum]|uniref:B9 domain-containing protein 2 n=1 Tax=Parasteatoda tepidariorum TaxID=114398 RepID=A0A2L2YR52_PARTP|nr:B9 domain-containing protein 2 [Parasteatoda tepidariorum]XP_015906951.1 B9 domain-containing protein 2 [Parasteatoda tepidariorum]
MCEVHIIGQILGASEFQENNLFCKWGLNSGGNWKIIEGLNGGQTQLDDPLSNEMCYWCHPVDVHYATKGIQGWPKFHFQVWHQDDYGRDQFVSYGFCHVPTSSGFHELQCVTWKPVSSFCDRIYEYFLGGGLQLKNPCNIYQGLERYRLQTTSKGIIHLHLHVITRNFDKYKIVTN